MRAVSGRRRAGRSVNERELLAKIEEFARAPNGGRVSAREALESIKVLIAVHDSRLGSNLKGPTTGPPSPAEASKARVLQNVLETIPYFVFWKDRNLNYLGCNDAFAHAAGLGSPQQIVGMNDVELPWKPEETVWFQAWDRRVMDSGRAELNIEEPQLQADGRNRFLSTSKVPLRNDDNEVIGVLGIFNDITERKELEQQLLLAKNAAEASASAKADFLAAMSHELRTPLTLILSSVEEISNQQPSDALPALVSSLARIQRNAERLKVLTDDVLEFSRYEAGHLQLKTRAADVGEHARQLLYDAEQGASARGLVLSTSVSDSLGSVMVDVAKFEKILTNLVGNALKFTPRGGQIHVALYRDGDELVLVVQDDGIGIDPSDHERIFLRFEQVDGGSTRRYDGTGIGLSLVRVFTEIMGGSIRLESSLGAGARFAVRIPALAAPIPADGANEAPSVDRAWLASPSAEQPVIHPSAPSPAGPAVVLAEDSAELRQYLTELMAREFRVTALTNGRSALEAIRANPPDVVVSDVMMPGMDGFELVAALKADPALASIPVLLLTARAGAEAAADGLNRGADDYLSKPFSASDLIARMRAAYRMKVLNEQLVEAGRRAAESEAREMLSKMRAELAHVSRVAGLGALTASVTHEVSQPLAGIVTNAGTCLRWLAVEPPNLQEAAEAARRIMRDGKRANEVLFRIRALFQKAEPAHEPLNLNEAIREVIVLCERELTEHGATLRESFADGLPKIVGDRVQLQQVLLNLLLNAAEAMDFAAASVREIIVSTRSTSQGVQVSVADSGPGLDPQVLGRVFDPFVTTKRSGMGMGLSISSTIVENHGGKLAVESKEGQGATFTFTLPVASDAKQD